LKPHGTLQYQKKDRSFDQRETIICTRHFKT
jgi:hypothetical protein